MMGCVHNVSVAVRSVAGRIGGAIKAVMTFPLTIKARGGWPWYLFLVAHVFLLGPLPFKLYNAVRPAHVFGAWKTDLSLAHVPNYETDGGALKPLAPADKRRVRDTMNRYSAYCQSLDGPRAEFCEHMQNRELLSAYNDFRKGRAKHCEGQWREEKNFEMFYVKTDEAGYHDLNPDPSSPLYDVTFRTFAGTLRGPYEEDAGLGDHARPPPKDLMTTDHDYVKSTCEFDSASSGGKWYVSRVGPFTDRTKGSWQWLLYHAFKDVARAASFSRFDAGSTRRVPPRYRSTHLRSPVRSASTSRRRSTRSRTRTETRSGTRPSTCTTSTRGRSTRSPRCGRRSTSRNSRRTATTCASTRASAPSAT